MKSLHREINRHRGVERHWGLVNDYSQPPGLAQQLVARGYEPDGAWERVVLQGVPDDRWTEYAQGCEIVTPANAEDWSRYSGPGNSDRKLGQDKIDSDHAQEIRSQTLQFATREAAQIVLEILKEEQTLAQLASTHGVHVTQLRKWKAQTLAGLPRLFDDEQKALRELEAEQAHERQELYAEIGRLTTQLGWLKATKSVAQNLASTFSRDERLTMVERTDPTLPLVTQVMLLGLNRTSVYYQPVLPSAAEVYIKRRIDAAKPSTPIIRFMARARSRSNCGKR